MVRRTDWGCSMCLMVYIASERALRTVPWNEESPGFHVTELVERDAKVKDQFDFQHVYYAGSHEGCGCGFQFGEYPDVEDDDRDEKRKSLDEFSRYLSRELATVREVEVFACWDGDQGAAPEHSRQLTPRSLLADSFYFFQRERSRFKPEAV